MTLAAAVPLKRTPLYPLHRSLGARMVPFAGYEMPVQYPAGILKEHLHTRAQAGLFDVSHMGQLRLGAAPTRRRRSKRWFRGDIARARAGCGCATPCCSTTRAASTTI